MHWYCGDLIWDCKLAICLYIIHLSVFLFADDNLNNYQWNFTKRGMCIDIVEIWFRIANEQILSMFELSACYTIVMRYYHFTFLFVSVFACLCQILVYKSYFPFKGGSKILDISIHHNP